MNLINKMTFNNKNINKFIDIIIKCNTIEDIFELCETSSIKGFIFERLLDIIIKLGYCDKFKNNEYNHILGNINNGEIIIMTDLNTYFNTELIISGNSSGCSDITLQHKETGKYIFITCKFPKNKLESKEVNYYDTANIDAVANNNLYIYKEYEIFIAVPNKEILLKKVIKANKSSNYITKHIISDNIIDLNDLSKSFLQFKQDIVLYNTKSRKINYNELYLNNKETLKLRFHQELITKKTLDLINESNKSFLWGCKCRSGKTYMSGGIIIKLLKKYNKLNGLIITAAPTETIPQFTEDLFNKFKDFNNFKIHNIVEGSNINKIYIDDNNIFILSKQLLQRYINEKTIKIIKKLKLDIIIFDENHFSGTTNISKDILESYSSKNTVKIYLTATYNKPLQEWNILLECQMYWDIEDEQICKSILLNNDNIIKLEEKHGYDYIQKTIEYFNNLGYNVNDIFKSYRNMPELCIISTIFNNSSLEEIKLKLNNENKMGFCFNTLFGLNKNKNKFSFENEVKSILKYISGSNKEIDGDKTIFPRINNICAEKETRHPFTQIWFLPPNNINEISQCLKILMNEDIILKQYKILCINRKNNELATNVKNDIIKLEIKAKEKGYRGVILLVGSMLKLGITLNNCDLVLLMNNSLSADTVLQQMYRCMTEANDKKYGFIVDLNISRILNTCINYTTFKNNNSVKDKFTYLITNRLINIDIDIMEHKKINGDELVEKLMNIWKEDPINSFKMLLKNLDNDYEEFDNSTQQLINNAFNKSSKDKININVKLNEDDNQELPSGHEKQKNIDNNNIDTKSRN